MSRGRDRFIVRRGRAESCTLSLEIYVSAGDERAGRGVGGPARRGAHHVLNFSSYLSCLINRHQEGEAVFAYRLIVRQVSIRAGAVAQASGERPG